MSVCVCARVSGSPLVRTLLMLTHPLPRWFVQADKQLRPSPAANSGPNVRDVIKVVDTKHQQTMETLMVEFSKMAKRFDSLANRLDDIDARTSKRGCC